MSISHELSIRNIVIGSSSGKEFCDNSIQTSKYNIFTFLPFGLMLIGTYTTLFDSPLTPWSTLIILGLVIIISMTRSGYEDYLRHVSDALTNSRSISVFKSRQDYQYNYKTVQWREIKVGDIVRLEKNQEIPADMLLISSSEEDGLAFVETSNIDGETNLKLKTSVRLDKMHPNVFNNLETFRRVEIVVKCEQPNSDIHHFNGSVYANGREEGVDASSLLLRGSSLRNTKHAVGIVVYTGKETKLVMNSRKPPMKVSYIERIMNQIIIVILWCQIVLAAISAILYYIWLAYHIKSLPYLCYDTSLYTNTLLRAACDTTNIYSSFGYIFSFFILYSNFIPISLYVTVEICNYFQAFFIDNDLQMYDPVSDTPALARTSNMNSDLGMVEYIFSDKTGTLTDNVMTFKRCSVAGTVYGDSPFEAENKESSESSKIIPENMKIIRGEDLQDLAGEISKAVRKQGGANVLCDFVLVLALCHTVIIDTESTNSSGNQLVSESPDEEALVKAATLLGFTFVGRSPGKVLLQSVNGDSVSYDLLATIPFDSTRKRMSVVVKRPDDSIVVYSKGADNIMFDRASHFVDSSRQVVPSQDAAAVKDTLIMHMDCFASDGLRTLVVAKKELKAEDYEDFAKVWGKAEKNLKQREVFTQQAAEMIENGLTILGVTAIEDKLQQGVPSTIADLRDAGIKLWVLTGDKMETAINIGYSSRLLLPNMILIKLAYKGEDTASVRRKLGTLLHHFQTLAEEHSDFYRKWLNRKRAFYQENINTGDNSTAPSNSENSENEEQIHFEPIQENSPLLQKSNQSPSLAQITCDHLGLIVDGETLLRIFSDSVSEHLFLALSMICRSVIACRVSPEQKRLIVRSVKKGVQPTPVTLSIGDGANDVAMIQEAQIGVGISGKEGRQAVNSSDFAIAQFRFLRRLLLVHGRLDYRRICKVVEYSFYKNIVSTFVVFLYTFYSAYSGLSFFEDSIHAIYNIVLAWPVIGFGIFDRDISEKTLLKYHFLYLSGRKRLDLNVTTMLFSIGQAMIDSLIIFYLPYYCYREQEDIWNSSSSHGHNAGLWVFGTTVYLCLMLAMFVKIVSKTYTWTWLSHLFFWGSLILFFIFLIWYQYWIDWSYNFYGITFEMMSSGTFWLLLLLVPTASGLVDSAIHAFRVEFFPNIVDIGIEFDMDASSLSLIPGWILPAAKPDSDEPAKTLFPKEFDEFLRNLLTLGTNRYILDWDNIKLYWSSFMASEQVSLGLLNTSTTNRAESTFNFDHVASNYNSSSTDSHVVHISAALMFPIQYVQRLATGSSSAPPATSVTTSSAPIDNPIIEESKERETLRDII